MGPPSGAGTCGTAAATYVPTSPNIRIEILIACFMVYSFRAPDAQEVGHGGVERNYKARVKLFRKKSFTANWIRLSGARVFRLCQKRSAL